MNNNSQMKPTVYIIEDDDDAQSLIKIGLRKAGFEVSTFSNGFPVLEMINNWPDAFILDIGLPGVNGFEIFKYLKAHNNSKAIPVIFLSASPDLPAIAGKYGCDAFLEKPFVMDDLVNRLNYCLVRNVPDQNINT
jgi:two-component system, OmpR family, response regulator CssR